MIGIDPALARRGLAHRFGVDITLDPSSDDESLVGRVRAVCRPDGPDAVIEVTGTPTVIPEGLSMLRAGGRYALAGVVNPDARVTIDANLILRRCLTVRGVHNYHPRHLVQALAFVAVNRKQYPFQDLVDGIYPLEQINDAFRGAAEQRVLRAAIIP